MAYAIIYTLNPHALQQACPGLTMIQANQDIDAAFACLGGFSKHASGVYWADETLDAVRCVLAAQALSNALPWFAAAVQSLRMIRIAEDSSLLPAIAANINPDALKAKPRS